METERTVHSQPLTSTHNQKVPKQLACLALGRIYPESREHVATPWVSKDIAAHITSEEPKFQLVLLVQSV